MVPQFFCSFIAGLGVKPWTVEVCKVPPLHRRREHYCICNCNGGQVKKICQVDRFVLKEWCFRSHIYVNREIMNYHACKEPSIVYFGYDEFTTLLFSWYCVDSKSWRNMKEKSQLHDVFVSLLWLECIEEEVFCIMIYIGRKNRILSSFYSYFLKSCLKDVDVIVLNFVSYRCKIVYNS